MLLTSIKTGYAFLMYFQIQAVIYEFLESARHVNHQK